MSRTNYRITTKDGLIHVGDDVNIVVGSDCYAYFVTEVTDQKHIKVKEYNVCGDRTKPGGMGHQDWVYFKTAKEEDEYLRKFGINHNSREYKEETWVLRYNNWYKVTDDGRYEKVQMRAIFGKNIKSYYYDWSF